MATAKISPTVAEKGLYFHFMASTVSFWCRKKTKLKATCKSSYTFSSYMYACNHCLWNYYYNLWNGQIGVVSFPSVWGWQPCQCFLLARWGQQCAGEPQNAQRSWSERNSNKPVGLDCSQVLVTGAFKKNYFLPFKQWRSCIIESMYVLCLSVVSPRKNIAVCGLALLKTLAWLPGYQWMLTGL